MQTLYPQLVATLEKLLELTGEDMAGALSRAADLIAEALGADKVDAFLLDPERDSLVALGVSDQPLSRLQRSVGLDVLPLANRGRAVEVYRTGEVFHSGALDRDPHEIVGIKETLNVRSAIIVPLEVDRVRRGAIAVAWQAPNAYQDRDVAFVNAVARWVGIAAHRAELLERIAKEAAERGRQMMAEELMTVLAHDLRNHLTPIELRFAVLRTRAEHDGRERDVADCDAGARVLGRLSRLINDILDLARLDRGVFQLDLGPCDVSALLRETAGFLSNAERPVAVDAPERVLALADANRIRQVLENLISNALQHSPPGASVRTRASQRGNSVCVEVADSGSGIPGELLPRIFDRFTTSRPGQGLGLGLYMARRIARLHGGELEVGASSTLGSRFVLTLPAAGSR